VAPPRKIEKRAARIAWLDLDDLPGARNIRRRKRRILVTTPPGGGEVGATTLFAPAIAIHSRSDPRAFLSAAENPKRPRVQTLLKPGMLISAEN